MKSTPLKAGAGAKSYLADWTVSLFPTRASYHNFVDGMCRTCNVLFGHDPENCSEIANDLDYRFFNFWRVLQGETSFLQFQRQVQAIPFSELEFREAQHKLANLPNYAKMDAVDQAVALFVSARMSRAGSMEDFATLTKSRLRGGCNEQANAWLSAVDRLPQFHARLQRVLFTCQDIFDVLKEWDQPRTVVYLDPPYLLERNNPQSRVTSKLYGRFDWDVDKHIQLLDVLGQVKHAYILLAGYASRLYEERLVQKLGWKVHVKSVPLQVAGGASKRRQLEHVFCNY